MDLYQWDHCEYLHDAVNMQSMYNWQLDEAQKPGEKKDEDNKPDVKSEENAIEMSEDFEGNPQDLEDADKENDSGDDEKDKDDEIDKQMGDVDDKSEDKLDEEMWGSDNEEEEEEEVCSRLNVNKLLKNYTLFRKNWKPNLFHYISAKPTVSKLIELI